MHLDQLTFTLDDARLEAPAPACTREHVDWECSIVLTPSFLRDSLEESVADLSDDDLQWISEETIRYLEDNFLWESFSEVSGWRRKELGLIGEDVAA